MRLISLINLRVEPRASSPCTSSQPCSRRVVTRRTGHARCTREDEVYPGVYTRHIHQGRIPAYTPGGDTRIYTRVGSLLPAMVLRWVASLLLWS